MEKFTRLITKDGCEKLISGSEMHPEFNTPIDGSVDLGAVIDVFGAIDSRREMTTRSYRLCNVINAQIYVYKEI